MRHQQIRRNSAIYSLGGDKLLEHGANLIGKCCTKSGQLAGEGATQGAQKDFFSGYVQPAKQGSVLRAARCACHRELKRASQTNQAHWTNQTSKRPNKQNISSKPSRPDSQATKLECLKSCGMSALRFKLLPMQGSDSQINQHSFQKTHDSRRFHFRGSGVNRIWTD